MFFQKKKQEKKIKPNTDGIYSYRDFRHISEELKGATVRFKSQNALGVIIVNERMKRVEKLDSVSKTKSKSRFKNIPEKSKIFLMDHLHLLLKSPAENHLRIQKSKKIREGQACNLSFDSYSQLKRYQKKVRILTYSSSSIFSIAVVALLSAQIFFSATSQGATFQLEQTSWTTQSSNTASHPGDKTGWSEYEAKDDSVEILNGGEDIQLANMQGQLLQTNENDFSQGTHDGTTVIGSGDNARISTPGKTIYVAGEGHLATADTKVGAWKNIYDYSKSSLNKTFFIDQSFGWAVGSSGTILKTINGGTTWTAQSSGTTASLNSVYFLDQNIGWVVGSSGVIRKTTNGGTTWNVQNSGLPNSVLIDVKFENESNGYITGDNFLKTIDGGNNWENMGGAEALGTGSNIYFVNTLIGWRIGSATVQKTIDGGKNWLTITNLGVSLIGMKFFDENIGFVVGGSGKISKTINGGTTWTTQTSGTTQTLNSLSFIDQNTGWAAGVGGTILKTTNGGTTWTAQTSGTTQNLNSLSFIDQNTGWAAGVGGTILKTTDGGTTWTAQASGTTQILTSLSFIDQNIGLAVGYTGTILKTTDGGTTWTAQTSGTTKILYSLSFIDQNTGWAAGEGGTILKTIDGGTTWTAQTNLINDYIKSVYFLNQNVGFALSFYGFNLKTIDGGSNWFPIYISSGVSSFVSGDIGWVIPNNITSILKTVDGGINWTVQNPGGNSGFLAINFVDQDNGWIVNSNGVIYGTINGGSTWTLLAINTGIKSLYRFNQSVAWVAGSNGLILKTTNGGTSWVAQNSKTSQNLLSIYFIDQNIGWATGLNGIILKTVDGGAVWDYLSGGDIRDIFFINTDTGFKVGNSGAIFKTINGGTTWTAQTSGTTQTLNSLSFIDQNTGWTVGSYGTILKTINSGTTWTAQASGTTQNLNSLSFLDQNTGWAAGGGGTILKTINGGTTWTAQTSGTTQTLYSLSFIDQNTGWAAGGGGTILKTINGGTTWTAQTSGTTQTLNSLSFIDQNTGWAAGSNGTIMKTINGGTSWIKLSIVGGSFYNDIYFVDENKGWVSGWGGFISETNDGGATWFNILGSTYEKSFFINGDKGWIAGSLGAILKTTDGGTTWTAQNSGTTQALNSLSFIDQNTGWVAGGGGTILKTINGGTTWTVQASGTTQNLISLSFIDQNTGWVAGVGGTILKTTNGGTTWTAQASGTTQILYSLNFIDQNTGWAAGAGGTILKTTDGGTTWIAQTSGTTQILYSLSFIDQNTGWAAGAVGTILKTTDGGTTWTAQTSGSINYLKSVSIIDYEKVFILGAYSTILKTTNGGVIWTSQGGNNNINYSITVASSAIAEQDPKFTSLSIEIGGKKNFSPLDFTINSDVLVETRFGNTIIPDDTWTAWVQIVDNQDIAQYSGNQYFQYKATFNDDLATLDDIAINYSYYQNGTLTSSKFNTSDEANVLAEMQWQENLQENTDVEMQIRTSPDNITWGDWMGTDGTNQTKFTDFEGGETMPSSISDGIDDQWMQYRMFLSTDGLKTPKVSQTNLTYVVNVTPEIQNTSAIQNVDGTVTVNFEIRDADTLTGATGGLVATGLQYCTADCQTVDGETWADATTVTHKNSLGNTLPDNNLAVDQADYSAYSIIWNPKTDYPESYNENIKIRVTADDGEAANSAGYGISNEFIIDTKNPTAPSFSIDHSVNDILIAQAPSDDSNYDLYLGNSLASLFNIENKTTLNQDSVYPGTHNYMNMTQDPATVYLGIKDEKGNTASSLATTPTKPLNVVYYDLSNVEANQYREFIAWDMPSLSQVGSGFVAYKIYRSMDNIDFTHIGDVIDRSVNYYLDSTVQEEIHYYYKILIQDSSGNKSAFSQTVDDVPNGQGGSDSVPPTISSVNVTDITTTSATINWTTDELSDSSVGYGEAETYLPERGSASMVLGHQIVLTNLDPGKTYNIRVKSRDLIGNLGQNDKDAPGSTQLENFTFSTNPGPAITKVNVTEVHNNEATIEWETSTDANSYVVYSDVISNGALSNPEEFGFPDVYTKKHKVTISKYAEQSLVENRIYYFLVKSKDRFENEATDNNGSLMYQLLTTQDDKAPIISGIATPIVSHDSVAINWVTDESADSKVEYGKISNTYNKNQTIALYDTSHFLILSNLDADTEYFYKVTSKDINGNTETSTEKKFITSKNLEFQHEPLTKIENIDVPESNKADTTALITFTTDQAALCYAQIDTISPTGVTSTTKFENGYLTDINYNTSHAIALTDLSALTKYSFTLSCHDNLITEGKENEEKKTDKFANWADSEAIDFTTTEQRYTAAGAGALGDKDAPVINNVKVASVDGESAVITWESDEKANSNIKFGAGATFTDIAGDVNINTDSNNYVTSHTVTLTGLIPATKYIFVASSTDVSGNIGQSAESSFTTASPSSLTSIKAESKNLGQATITWTTSSQTSSTVEYGLTSSYGEKKESSTLTKEHSLELTSLNQGTTYHYRVKGKDDNGKLYASSDQTFEPKSPPQINNININDITEHEAKITFQTNVPTNATVTYTNISKPEDNGSQSNLEMATKHSIQLKNLSQGSTFKISISARDEQGTESIQEAKDITTGKDENPPKIDMVKTDLALTQNDKVQAIISWKTDEQATTTVTYKEGRTGEEKDFKAGDSLTTSHIAVITSFKPGIVYYFNAKSKDASGNLGSSTDFALLTPKKRQNIIQIIIGNFTDIFGWAKF